jgi:collagenase-like PrtC family protease
LMGPGGTLEMTVTALDRGCESVFVGPKGWSRRPASDELSDEEIREAIAYANSRSKDIRIAINVMPTPEEIPAFLAKVERFATWGAGGVMICDPGCIQLVRRAFPDLEIHVSVTAGIFNLEDIHLYRDLGANIVVVPYRWGIAELEHIRDKAQVQLEAFLFQTVKRGRICPGRCYSSSYFHINHTQDAEGKDHFVGSASRGGSCHRVCRAEWDLAVGGAMQADTPDLKATPELLLWEMPEYVELGVSRFKIPGRERSVALVGDIVGFYRRVLDHILSGNKDVSAFETEWLSIRERWARERGRRDTGRITTAAMGA